MNVNLIPCTTWVKRGVAAAVPDKVQLTPQELEKIIKSTHSQIGETEESDSEAEENANSNNRNEKSQSPSNTKNENDEFEFENYDDESDAIKCDIGGLTLMDTDGTDPLIENEDADSEAEDDLIKPDDNLVLLGHVEGDASILEVFVYNENEGSFYCHHDIILPSFPLCLEWLSYDPSESKKGNLCAIGNMTPIIDIWDLDLIDCIEPVYKLGCKASKKKKLKAIGHKDAVLDIAWNTNFPHVLASGSVDQTVLLWDLDNGSPVNKFKDFDEKVQSIKWHPSETHLLLTGSADHKVRLFDCKSQKVKLHYEACGEVEKVLWNNSNNNFCFVSTENGYIECFDIRTVKALWQHKLHDKEIIGLSMSIDCPGLLVSASNDGAVKVYNVDDNMSLEMIFEKQMKLGAVHCLAASPDSPLVFSLGGDNKSRNFEIVDFSNVEQVKEKFDCKKVSKKTEAMDVSESFTSEKKKKNKGKFMKKQKNHK